MILGEQGGQKMGVPAGTLAGQGGACGAKRKKDWEERIKRVLEEGGLSEKEP